MVILAKNKRDFVTAYEQFEEEIKTIGLGIDENKLNSKSTLRQDLNHHLIYIPVYVNVVAHYGFVISLCGGDHIQTCILITNKSFCVTSDLMGSL